MIRSIINVLPLFLLLFSTLTFHGQQRIIDSLLNELEVRKEIDTVRVNTLDYLAFYYHRINIDKALEYAEKGETLAMELKFDKGIANALYTRGILEYAQSNYDQAISYYEGAAQMYTDLGIIKNLAGCYNGLGIIYSFQGDLEKSSLYYEKAIAADKKAGIERNMANYIFNIAVLDYHRGLYPKAIENYKKALDLFNEGNNQIGVSNSLKNIALIYDNQGNYPLALDYHNQALTLAIETQDSIGISNSFNNIGVLYKKQKSYDKALELFNKALAIYQKSRNNKGIAAAKTNIGSIYVKKDEFNTALSYFTESIAICRAMDIKDQIAQNLNNVGFVYTSIEEFDKSTQAYIEAISINAEIENSRGSSMCYMGLADNYMVQKQYDKALPNIMSGLDLANQLGLVDVQRDAYKFLAEVYRSRDNYKMAYESHQQFKTLNDSLFNKENVEKITQLEYDYKYKRALDSASIRELTLKQKVITTTNNLEKSQRNIFLTIIAFLLTAIILGGIIFYLRLRNEKAKTQNIAIEQKLLRSQMTPHFIFNSLSVLQGMILNKEEKKSISYLSKFSKLLRITLENSRDKMVPLAQELEGLDNYIALQNLDANPPFEYSLQIDENIDKDDFEIPPMLIQPFIENAIEHAFVEQKQDREIAVSLQFQNQQLICTIKDNGVGIDAAFSNGITQKKSLATKITSERLAMLAKDFKQEASIQIEDRKKFHEQGTLVTIVIPYRTDSKAA